MVEGDAGARKGLLNRGGDAIGVAIGGDGDGATVVDFDESGAYVLGDGVRVASLWHLTVLYVPPHRRLRPYVLRLRQAHLPRQSPAPTSHISTHASIYLSIFDLRSSISDL